MTPDDIPVLGALRRVGPDDRVFDLLLLTGPLVVACIALLGRGPVTGGLAVVYLLVLVGRVAYNATAA
jgi:hypothetical protein